MAKVVSRPPIRFDCQSCGCTVEAEAHEFSKNNTMPPTWKIKCPNCNCLSNVSPPALIAKEVGNMFR